MFTIKLSIIKIIKWHHCNEIQISPTHCYMWNIVLKTFNKKKDKNNINGKAWITLSKLIYIHRGYVIYLEKKIPFMGMLFQQNANWFMFNIDLLGLYCYQCGIGDSNQSSLI